MSQLLNMLSKAHAGIQKSWSGDPRGDPSASGNAFEGGSLAWPVCASCLSRRSWLPTCLGEQAPGAGGPLSCVRPYVGVGSGAGCLCLVCDPALEGSCPVSPEGATTKVAGRWWGRKAGWPCSVSRLPASAGSFPGNWTASIASLALPLQAAFLLPQCLMPGHTATEYAICVGDRPHAHTPTPGSPRTPEAAAASASL
uniref:Uncharacterized protein n=1 Tax=Pipistrellus kuhlii TaxID=59472 RepID=A0A7J7VUM6_PIPKU|nr:hypothetical protein mPipKuh1_008259 [Pipistrellus kuhlii]